MQPLHVICFTAYRILISMKQSLFIRNVQARDQLELFLVSGVSSLLLLRFYLYATGYPQVGGGSLHIAHMLYGGLLMLVAIVLMLSFLGRRVQRLCALIGGIGFGIFIDEIGKFLTKDNNYFFRPSVGIIYAIFTVLYLSFSFLSRRQHLSSREYQLNALAQLEEAVLLDMDMHEKQRVVELLKRADPRSPITQHLERFLESVRPVPAPKPNAYRQAVYFLDNTYRRIWHSRSSNYFVQIFFLFEAGLFLLAVFYTAYNNIDSVYDFFRGQADYGHSLVLGQLASTVVASAFAAIGVYRLVNASRASAFEWFRRATLINLLLTEFFIFSRIQFGAIPSFLFNLGLLILIDFVVAQENRQMQDVPAKAV